MKNFIRRVALFELLIFVIMIIIQNNIIRAEEVHKINFQKINVKDGLSNRNITTIYQDSRGYIWIGTANGLNRYNGHEINIYSNEIGNEKSLSSNYISSIIEDDYGNMWIGTTGGLNILDVEKNEITRISNKISDNEGTIHFNITALYKDSKGRVWVGTEYGLKVYDNITGEMKEYTTDGIEGESLTNNYVTVIEEDGLGNIWIGTKKGINVFVEETNRIESNIKKDYKYIKYIENDINRNMWIASKDGIERYSFENQDIHYKYCVDSRFEININQIISDKNNNIWFATSEGLSKYNKNTGEKNQYKTSVYEQRSISSDYVTCLFEDKDGVIWVGTDNGVNVINLGQQFNLLNLEYLNSEKLKNISVTDIFEDSDSNYWIGTKNSGIRFINNLEGNVVSYYYDENKENSIWMGTRSGLICYYEDTGEIVEHKLNFDINGITDINIVDIYQDSNDKDILWLGGGLVGGLIKFNKKSGVEKRYVKYINRDLKNYGSVNSIKGDSIGNLWIGTDVGLVKFNIDTEEFHYYTEKDGLIDNYIYSLLIDNDENIWMATDKGISKLNINTGKFNNYIEGNEVFVGGFNVRSALKMKDGLMFLGGAKGLLFFNPEDIIEDSSIDNNVVIENITVNNEKNYFEKDDIKLKYNENNIRIKFFSPNYKNLGSIKYDYMLEGFDKEWICGSYRNSVRYTSLSPGKYNFKVRATDINGNVSDVTNIKILVKRPYWRTPVAYIIYIIIFLIIVACVWDYVRILEGLFKNRTVQLNMQLEQNNKLYKEIIKNEKFKNAYFVNLSHELRTPLNVILSTVQLVNLLNKDEGITKEKSSQYMKIIEKSSNTLLKVINDIVDSSKIETGNYKINKEKVDIVYVVEEAALNMSNFIEEKGIEFTIDPEIEEKIVYCDPTEIERCTINLLANAAKFTPEGGKINLYIRDRDNEVDIIVEDTGIGISEEDQSFIFNRFSQVEGVETVKCSSSGIGLTLVKYLVELHGGRIRLESEVDKGSKFIITLPII